ncbi:hypothetical protein [Nannocystis pusilla]|uniref:hypothetical protein n=1 Tax=Nannocystis pusilla TaxID=889268 RepID=UPI003B7F735A
MYDLGEAGPQLERLAATHGTAAFELPPPWPDADPQAGVLLRVRGRGRSSSSEVRSSGSLPRRRASRTRRGERSR